MGRAKKLPIPLAIVPLCFLFSCPQPPYDITGLFRGERFRPKGVAMCFLF